MSGVYQNDGTEWLFFFNSFNQIIYRWTPPNSPAQVLTLTVLRSPINGNPFSISAVVLDNLVSKFCNSSLFSQFPNYNCLIIFLISSVGLKYIHIYFFCITAVNYSSQPWVFYLSIFDILSDVRLRATPGHEFERGTLASLNLRASAQSPIYATTTNQSEHRIVVWYIPFDSNGEWASASLDSENRWTRNTWSGISLCMSSIASLIRGMPEQDLLLR